MASQDAFLTGVYSSNDLYYDCFDLERDVILKCIRHFLSNAITYNFECYAKYNNEELLGSILVLPNDQLDRLQLALTHMLLQECRIRKVDTGNVLRQLSEFSKKVEKLSANGFYVYSFFISEKHRGKKYGENFLENCLTLLAHKKSFNDKIYLHVREQNLPALRIYENLYFQRQNGRVFEYPVLERSILVE